MDGELKDNRYMDEYRFHATLYDPIIGPFLSSTYRDMVDILCEHGCGTLLDLCCGTGLLVGKAQQAGLESRGVDLSPAMLDVARSNYPDIEFLESDASKLPMDTASFDAVTICFALHEKPRMVANDIIQEGVRLVRKGGLLLVADYRFPADKSSPFTGWGIRFVERIAGKEHHAHFKDYMTRGGSESFLAEAGLKARCRATHMAGWSGVFAHVIDT